MSSWQDAGGSQAARLLFEGEQNPAAGLDGGRSDRGMDHSPCSDRLMRVTIPSQARSSLAG